MREKWICVDKTITIWLMLVLKSLFLNISSTLFDCYVLIMIIHLILEWRKPQLSPRCVVVESDVYLFSFFKQKHQYIQL